MRLSIKIILLFISILFYGNSHAQLINKGFFGNEVGICPQYNQSADKRVVQLIDFMCNRIGLVNRFDVVPCNEIKTVQASVVNGKPAILYNEKFISSLNTSLLFQRTPVTRTTECKILTILAHEIGHLFNFHLVNRDPQKSNLSLELEADQFSGNLSYMLGITLPQAQAIMYDPLVKEANSESHPGRTARLEAIRIGYTDAELMFPRDVDGGLPPLISKQDAEIISQLRIADTEFENRDSSNAVKIYKLYSTSKFFSNKNKNNLGVIFLYGYGVPKDYSEALRWIREAAESGLAVAQNNLGYIYEKGFGVMQNYQEAVKWYRLAIIQDESFAMANLASLMCKSVFLKKNLDSAFILYEAAVAQGNASAEVGLGTMYALGFGVQRDFSQAIYYFRKSVNHKFPCPSGECSMGLSYVNGWGVVKDVDIAVDWFKKSADHGDPYGQTDYGVLFARGVGVRQNDKTAAEWFKKAADQGLAEGQFYLAECFEEGRGLKKDINMAMELYMKSAKGEYDEAVTACKRLNVKLSHEY